MDEVVWRVMVVMGKKRKKNEEKLENNEWHRASVGYERLVATL